LVKSAAAPDEVAEPDRRPFGWGSAALLRRRGTGDWARLPALTEASLRS
jgi:hypothetical protein